MISCSSVDGIKNSFISIYQQSLPQKLRNAFCALPHELYFRLLLENRADPQQTIPIAFLYGQIFFWLSSTSHSDPRNDLFTDASLWHLGRNQQEVYKISRLEVALACQAHDKRRPRKFKCKKNWLRRLTGLLCPAIYPEATNHVRMSSKCARAEVICRRKSIQANLC